MPDPNYKKMERQILETAASGEIMTPNHPAFKSMCDSQPPEHNQALTCTLIHLVNHGYLVQLYEKDGNEARNGWSRGMSPRGYHRLQQIRHPIRSWTSQNWFPLSNESGIKIIFVQSISMPALGPCNSD